MTDAGGHDAAPPRSGGPVLEVGTFSFHGYDGLLGEIGRRLRTVEVRGGAPAATVVEGAVFVPEEGRRSAPGQPKFAGGVVDAEGRPVEAALLRRKGGRRVGGLAAPVTATPARELDEEVVYLGWIFNHYGRVLLETLARVWYLTEVDPSVRVVVSAANAGQGGWLPGVLATFGIPPERQLVLDQRTRFRRAIVPEPLFEEGHAAHATMVRPFRAVARKIAGEVTPSAPPVYLSRRLLSSRSRPIVGEEELEDVLRENGFLIAHPETMTFDEQVRLFNAHADIFSSVGSAAHTILFSLGRPTLHLLANGADIPANFFLCSALAEAPTTFVDCLGSGDRGHVARGREIRRGGRRDGAAEDGDDVTAGTQAGPHRVHVDKLVGYLEERGLLRSRLRASLAGRDPALRERYDEAWFYAQVRGAVGRRGSLPPALEEEVARLAAGSWPLSWVLARYYAIVDEDAARADATARRFVELVAAESNMNRLAHYREDIRSMTRRIARICASETADLLTTVMRDRFRIDDATADAEE
jgi:hypothetical protein